MIEIDKLDVFFNDTKVGTLGLSKGNRIAFQYDKDWLVKGFSISPFSLPLKNNIFFAKYDPFDGLFGVFADSLSDGWGRLLLDRMLRKKGVDPFKLSSLARLAIIGDTGMGALTYKPQFNLSEELEYKDLDELCASCKLILKDDNSADNLDLLFKLGGSSGGARPKILTNIDDESWIVKFPSSYDYDNVGKMEYDYMACAKKCGIDVPEFKLFPSKNCNGYFGVKRFDRHNQERIHMVSVSALLETSHRWPNLDYNDLMKLTRILTESYAEIEKMFKLMCFNVFSHNRDDHSKNFSYIYDYKEKCWKISPAYDLTYSNSIGGEHATTVDGNGSNPDIDDIIRVGEKIGLPNEKCEIIAKEIKNIVVDNLSIYLR